MGRIANNGNKKILRLSCGILTILFFSVGIICFFAIKKPVERKTFKPLKKIVIGIDAGHGGIDKGAVSDSGTLESEINLLIASNLSEIFEKAGYSAVLTRKDGEGLYGDTSSGFKLRDLKERLKIVNESNCNLFISIHLNKYSSKLRRGAQAFYKGNDESSKKLAESIQTELNLLEESKRMYDALTGDYYLLNSLKIPSVIVECGFLSNDEEEALLNTEAYRKKLAKTIYNGVVRYLISF
ncbi:MAG: N-acetylmuramoyl-L-alanine amidase [Clostridia bacterium]|nr:N-acetylmuramoyl-L-alanine amidase [Clostridia bacterium]